MTLTIYQLYLSISCPYIHVYNSISFGLIISPKLVQISFFKNTTLSNPTERAELLAGKLTTDWFSLGHEQSLFKL